MDNPLRPSTPAARLQSAVRGYARRHGLFMGEAESRLSASAGIPVRRIYRLRRGFVRFYVEDCEQLALALGVRAEWLAFGSGVAK